VFPNWNTNPYLNLLFLEARARGWQISGGVRLENLLLDLEELEPGDVFHIQWTGPLTVGATSAEEYDERIDTLAAAIRKCKSRGVMVLWTVQNVLAHDTPYPQCEARLGTLLTQVADRIIVLNSNTREVALPFYDIPPEKIFHLPHCSYLGVYSGPVTSDEARDAVGIPRDVDVMGFVGVIRPYKGVGDLLGAGKLVADRRSGCAVALAGLLGPAAEPEIEAHLPYPLPLHRHHKLLSNREIVNWVAACSVMVLPFRNVLNSGSLLLAASYGVPVVLPRLDHLVSEFGDGGWISFFDPIDDDERRMESIATAVEEALDARPGNQDAALQFARSTTLYQETRSYADLLEDLN